MLTDKRWQKLLQVMKNTGHIYNRPKQRMTFKGILYRLRTGIHDVIFQQVGNWSTVHRLLWSKKGMLDKLLKKLSKLSDNDCAFADSSIVKAHQHSVGSTTTDNAFIGKSRGGDSTKTHLVANSCGLPIYFKLSKGKRNDIARAESFVGHLKKVNVFIADKGYLSDAFRAYVE
jgi:hypothetical protein